MMRHVRTAGAPGLIAEVLLALGSPTLGAGQLDAVLGSDSETIRVAQASQQRIDEMVEETRDLAADYRHLLKEIEGLDVYNEYMQRQIADQAAELDQLRSSIDRASGVERQITPLMIRMLEGLDRFVALDLPFLKQERTKRVAGLEALMERSDVSTAEKFRRLMEAFQIEIDFGRTIEAYKDTLTLDDATLEVNVLRLGRVAMFYQTNDARLTGAWDRNAGKWTVLTDSRSRDQVRQGLRVARKQVAPDLLLLPVAAPQQPSGASS